MELAPYLCYQLDFLLDFFTEDNSCQYCRGAMNNKVLGLWSRRGLLAYVYTGVSVLVTALVVGKWLLYTTAQWP